ncbi:MAG: NAD(P)/FAD-dependent oxidoreductase [Gemmatimonadota bacterium]
MTERYDAIVLGMGPGGEVVADRLLTGGMRVAVVERELIGGECAYWACIPSKTLLRPPEARAAAARTSGVSEPSLEWARAIEYRDFMVRHLDDSKQEHDYEERGATVIRGSGRIAGPGTVEVGGKRLLADHLVIATGSDPRIPPIRGLADVRPWTNREATSLREVPARVVLIGGGPVGVELGQMLARFGSEVTIVQAADRLLNREDPRIGELIRMALESEGIRVETRRQVRAVRKVGSETRVDLDGGTEVAADVLVIGAGRSPRLADVALDKAGVDTSAGRLPIDRTCRLAEGLWVVGDATGVMLFTHVAKYQGRIAAANILGRRAEADYRSVPRVVFSDPEIAAVGLSEEAARAAGIDLATATLSLSEAIARPWTYERDPRGELGLVADRRRGVLIGAWAVAPLASEWIHHAVVAIRAEIPIATLLDTIAQFPTYAEAYLRALEKLDL